MAIVYKSMNRMDDEQALCIWTVYFKWFQDVEFRSIKNLQ